MRIGSWTLLAGATLLSGCGGGDSGPTLLVRCDSGTSLVGAASMDIATDINARGATLKYPDPVNVGKTGTIAIPAGQGCKVTIDKGK